MVALQALYRRPSASRAISQMKRLISRGVASRGLAGVSAWREHAGRKTARPAVAATRFAW